MAGRPKIEPLRWTINQIVLEFNITANKFRMGCRVHEIEAGKDGRYSTRQVVDALFRVDALEKRAKEARWKLQIEEAEDAKLQRLETAARLVPKAEVQEFLTDAMLRLTQIIRHSKLPPADKKRAIHELNSVEFKGGKIDLNSNNGSLAT